MHTISSQNDHAKGAGIQAVWGMQKKGPTPQLERKSNI